MNMPVLDQINITINLDQLRKRLHMEKDRHLDEIRPLIEVAEKLIDPRALYDVRYID